MWSHNTCIGELSFVRVEKYQLISNLDLHSLHVIFLGIHHIDETLREFTAHGSIFGISVNLDVNGPFTARYLYGLMNPHQFCHIDIRGLMEWVNYYGAVVR